MFCFSQGERTKFDRFDIRVYQARSAEDIRIYKSTVIEFFLRLKKKQK